jgi:hypothetical protein
MDEKKIETASGTLESIKPLKQSKNGTWYLGVYIDGQKYNKFGKLEELKKVIPKVESKIGNEIRFGFKKKIRDDNEYRELIWLAGVFVGGNQASTSNSLFIVSESWSPVDGRKLNIKKLKMGLKCIAVDCNFLHDELDKVEE